jgi:hypothetical protein
MRNYAMSIRRISDRNLCMEGDCERVDPVLSQDSLVSLRELLEDLARRIHESVASGSEALESWDGGDYLYVEAPLPAADGVEIDVTIQGGRAVIRIAQ